MSSAVIYQNIAAATPFVAAIGIGAGLGFYLYFRYKIGCEERQQARQAALAELNNIDYILRRDLEALPKELQVGFSQLPAELGGRKKEIMEALDANDAAAVEKNLAELAFFGFQIRQKLGEQSCVASDSKALLRNLNDLITELLPGCLQEDQDEMRGELQTAAAAHEPDHAIAMLETLLARVERSVRLRGILGDNAASMAEEGFVPQQSKQQEQDDLWRIEINRFHLLIKGYDQEAWLELQPLVSEARQKILHQRLVMIRDMVKLRYGKIKESAAITMALRSYITRLHQQLETLEGSESLQERAAMLLAQRSISREEYAAFSADTARHMVALREEALLIADMREKLSALGYQVSAERDSAISHDQPIFFDTRWDEYKVLVRIGANGELVTRLARIVASELEKSTSSDYQRQRDIEVAHSWCHDFDSFIVSLQQQGYRFKTVMRKEPEEEGVICIVDAAMAARQRNRAILTGTGTAREQSVER